MNSKAATCSSIDERPPAEKERPGPIGQNGYTIIEVMIAIAIFSIGILAAWALQTSSTRANTQARNLTLTAACASDRLEQLIQLPYLHADLAAGAHAPNQDLDGIDNNFDGEVDEAGEAGPLRVSWLVSDNVPFQRAKTIRVDVSMRQRSVSVTSYRADL